LGHRHGLSSWQSVESATEIKLLAGGLMKKAIYNGFGYKRQEIQSDSLVSLGMKRRIAP
jgi:hypothetical protein